MYYFKSYNDDSSLLRIPIVWFFRVSLKPDGKLNGKLLDKKTPC